MQSTAVGEQEATVVLSVCKPHPAVVSVPVGVRTAAEVVGNDQRYRAVVPDALWAELDARRS